MVATDDALTNVEQQVGTESQDASSCKTEFATECLIYNIVRGQRAVTTNLAKLEKCYSESLVVDKWYGPWPGQPLTKPLAISSWSWSRSQ